MSVPPASKSNQAIGLERVARDLSGSIGTMAATFLGPAYLVSVFAFLRWLEPRALGTYSFLIGGPLLLAVLALRFSGRGFLRSFLVAMMGVTLFGSLMFAGFLESGLCLVVLLAPFLMLGATFSLFLNLQKLRKVRRAIRELNARALLLCLFLPALALAEPSILEVASSNELETMIVTPAGRDAIWREIVEVAPLTEEELPRTWLRHLGMPRPVRAALETVDGERVRVGYFEEGLRFIERFSTNRSREELGLSVAIDTSSLRKNDWVRHAFDQGFFEIDDVRYRVTSFEGSRRVSLTCRYTVHTSVPAYAHFVARVTLGSFQRGLLAALAVRFEHGAPPSGTMLLAEGR